MRAWPLSGEELRALRESLARQMSMVKVIDRFSKQIEEVGAGNFTHKCICPNPEHKQGNERTPSFYFSEETKQFVCWGCGINGDLFDFLELMLKRPADQLAQNYAKKKQVDVEECLKYATAEPMIDIGELSYRLGIQLRDHLAAFKGKDEYEAERIWVDNVFLRIDDRFSKLDRREIEQAQQFVSQIEMELERRR